MNNRKKLPAISKPPSNNRSVYKPWEACMTMNDSWGYQRADDDWKPAENDRPQPGDLCARRLGTIPNIGPKPDGSIPDESVRILGAWSASG